MKLYFTMAGLVALAATGLVSAESPNAELSFDESYYLNVPMVDIPGAPGAFQDAVFEKHPTDPNWYLLSVERPDPLRVSDVELVVTDELPAQAFVRLSGLIGMCSEVGNVAVASDGNSFSVNLYYRPQPPLEPGEDPPMCLDGTLPFSRVVPLPVYGLDAGTYSYSVNGKHVGEFELEQDNVLPD